MGLAGFSWRSLQPFRGGRKNISKNVALDSALYGGV